MFIGIILLFLFSCQKEIIEPTINHVSFSEEVVQTDFDNSPSFEIKYSDNNVINGEITLQSLDETGTLLRYLPNSTLFKKNGIIRINNIAGLKNKEKYFLKIENCSYNNSYYSFTIKNDTVYEQLLLIPFKIKIDNNIENIFLETFNLIAVDDYGPQMAIKYGAKINNNDIILNNINIYLTIYKNPWDIFEYIYVRDKEGFLIIQRLLTRENSWIKHNDSTYQVTISNLWYPVKTGDFIQNIQFEILNCITPVKIKVRIKNYYQDNYNNEIKILETRSDSLKMKNPKKIISKVSL